MALQLIGAAWMCLSLLYGCSKQKEAPKTQVNGRYTNIVNDDQIEISSDPCNIKLVYYQKGFRIDDMLKMIGDKTNYGLSGDQEYLDLLTFTYNKRTGKIKIDSRFVSMLALYNSGYKTNNKKKECMRRTIETFISGMKVTDPGRSALCCIQSQIV